MSKHHSARPWLCRIGNQSLDLKAGGSKAAALSVVASLPRVTVPHGFVLMTDAHQKFLELSDHRQAQAALSMIWNEVKAELSSYPADVRWAVRSSGTLEDMHDASFAGQYKTFLGVPREGIEDAIIQCWQSRDESGVKAYAQERGIEPQVCLMGIIVQEMVPAECAGVSFSSHPLKGPSTLVINASWGLGESVVAGLVTPDTFEMDRLAGAIQSTLGDKESLIRLDRNGQTEQIDTPEHLARQYCLTSNQAAEVFRLTLALEHHRGYPVDVEWAIANCQLYCLQVRPITTQVVSPHA